MDPKTQQTGTITKTGVGAKKHLILLIAVVFIAVAGITGGVYLINQRNTSDEGSKQAKDPALLARQAEIEKDNPDFIEQRDKYIDEGVKNADNPEFSDEQKTLNYLFLAGDYEGVGDYENAIKMYEKVVATNDPVYLKNVYIEIGNLYKKLDDRNRAFDSYNKAKENILELTSGQEQESMLRIVEDKIKELGTE